MHSRLRGVPFGGRRGAQLGSTTHRISSVPLLALSFQALERDQYII